MCVCVYVCVCVCVKTLSLILNTIEQILLCNVSYIELFTRKI